MFPPCYFRHAAERLSRNALIAHEKCHFTRSGCAKLSLLNRGKQGGNHTGSRIAARRPPIALLSSVSRRHGRGRCRARSPARAPRRPSADCGLRRGDETAGTLLRGGSSGMPGPSSSTRISTKRPLRSERHRHMRAMLERVVDQIGGATLERIALDGKRDALAARRL